MLAGMYLLAPPVVDDDYTAPEYLEVVGIGYVTDCELVGGLQGRPHLRVNIEMRHWYVYLNFSIYSILFA
jgi:hypothetical protein